MHIISNTHFIPAFSSLSMRHDSEQCQLSHSDDYIFDSFQIIFSQTTCMLLPSYGNFIIQGRTANISIRAV